jgi:hypothetical protein
LYKIQKRGGVSRCRFFCAFCFSFSIPQQQKSDGAARTARPTVQAAPQTFTPQNGITVGATTARFKQAKPRNGIPKS